MANLGEFGRRGAGDALGGAVWGDEVRELGFELAELVLERIGRGFGHNGLVEHMVVVAVIVDLVAQFCDAVGGFGMIHGPIIREKTPCIWGLFNCARWICFKGL